MIRIPFTRSFLLLLLTAALQSAPAQFEGIIESKNSTIDEQGGSQEFSMTMWVKKDMVRIHTSSVGSSPASTMIYRTDLKIIWMLNDDDKTYFQVAQDVDQSRRGQGPGLKEDKPVVKRTGKTRKTLGYTCEQILISRDGEETEIWGTKSLGGLTVTLSRALGEEQSDAGGWNDELTKLGIFPLSARTRLGDKVVDTQEISRIAATKLSPDLFELPMGYRKQNATDIVK
jgi:hypothetical protein